MAKTDTTVNHAAPGQFAGYLFQPERALFHLAVAGRGSVVGIETLDDVAVVDKHGRVIREQDKHYTSRRKPLADRSKEFWNSLHTWLSAITNEGLEARPPVGNWEWCKSHGLSYCHGARFA